MLLQNNMRKPPFSGHSVFWWLLFFFAVSFFINFINWSQILIYCKRIKVLNKLIVVFVVAIYLKTWYTVQNQTNSGWWSLRCQQNCTPMVFRQQLTRSLSSLALSQGTSGICWFQAEGSRNERSTPTQWARWTHTHIQKLIWLFFQ